MRKKKLLSRISELESEVYVAKMSRDYWKGIVRRFVKGLHKCGVKVEIVFPESPKIEASTLEEECCIDGRTSEPPTLRFDFTEHDAEVGNL